MITNPIPHGANPELDRLYEDLEAFEQKEFDCIHFGRIDLLPEVRASMIPIKRKINELEGQTIYQDANENA